MGRAVGVELGEADVRLLLLERSGRKTRILRFHEAPIAPGEEEPWEAAAARALRDAFTESKLPRGNIAGSLDTGEAILRELTLPFKGEEQIQKTARFEMESQIHNYTIEQLVVSHYKTGETDKGSLLLAAAVPKAVVARRLKALQDGGADPASLDLDVCAVFNAAHHAGVIDTDEPHLLLYGGSRFTKIVMIEGRKPRSIRTLRFEMPEAGSFSGLDQKARTALADLLGREISRFLLANASGSNPAHLLLAGAFQDAEAARLLGEVTKLPVRTLDVLGAIEHDLGERAAELAPRLLVALGMALKGAGVDALGMDFRQEEFAYQRRFEAVKTTLLVTAELVIVLLAAMALYLHFKKEEYADATAMILRDYHADLYQTVAEDNIPLEDPSEAYVRMQKLLKSYTGTDRELPLITSGREAWRQLFDRITDFQKKYLKQTLGDASLYVELLNLQVRQNTTQGNESFEMTLEGKVRNHEWAGKLREEIRRAELLKEADWKGPIRPDGDLYRFSLRAYVGKRKKGNP